MLRADVDRFWSRFFGLDARDLRRAGVRVVSDAPGLPGYRGVFLLRLDDGCTIGAPGDVAGRVRSRADAADVDTVFTRDGARALVAEDAALVLGPSIHAYVDPRGVVEQPPCDARPLGPSDDDVLARLHAAVDDDEWGEGGFARQAPYAEVVWGAFEDGDLVAAGNLTDFDGRPADVGIVTRPDSRGRGLASRLVSMMVADALRTVPVVRYRALESNAASRRVAAKLGFVPDGANIAVRLSA